MEDITPAVLIFREAARHVWNTALLRRANADIRDDFDDMCEALFRAVILRPIEMEDVDLSPASRRAGSPLPFLRVVPSIEHGTRIMVNRTVPPSGYWDDPVTAVIPNEIDLRFVRFFDWDELGHREFQFVEAIIQAFPKHPALVGRSALLDVRDVTVFFEPENAVKAG